jgi:methionyl-tRNA synthetase
MVEEVEKLKKVIITCALPYSNGELHLGHIASTYLPADIFARFCRLNGREVIFISGGDDYGTPILVKAEAEGKNPETYVEEWHEKHEKDFKDLNISFDFYYQTHSPENIQLTQHFFQVLNKKGFIFKKEIEQFYCEKDKKFLPDRYIKGTCPFCNAKDQYGDGCEKCGRTYSPLDLIEPKCAICGNEPVIKKSLHYFFKLSVFAEKLKKWLNENKNLQQEVKNYVLNWIEEGLRDWDITRDINWGVPIPGEQNKVFYGWFDNHLGYISFTLKYLSEKGVDGKLFWNSAKIYHFIGKDIVYHHYLFLPAMRLGEGSFKLPDFIPVRGHLLLEGRKFSKSRGIYISVRDFLEKFPADYLRYYLASITPYSQVDANFEWNAFEAKINNELVANIGNFIYRVLSFIWKEFDGKVPEKSKFDGKDEEFEKRIEKVAKEISEEMEKLEFDKALKKILEFSAFCNQYFQRKEPWKTKDANCLYLGINAVRSLAILLEPFIPSTSEKLWKQLNLEGSVHKQNWYSASELKINAKHKINEPEILFKKIEV